MKNKLLMTLAMTALIMSPTFSSAQDISASVEARTEIKLQAQEELEARKQELNTKRETIREEIQTRTETLRAEMEEKRETVRNEVEQRREKALNQIRERLSNFIEKIIDRYEAAVSRLERLAERIDSRIAKFEEKGIDAAEAKDLLAVAKLKIETAKASIAAIEVESEVTLSNTSTTTSAIKNDFQGLRAQIEQAKTDIKAAHAALVEVVKSLRLGQMRLEAEVETTL